MNTFVGHEWSIENDDGVVWETTIQEVPLVQAVYVRTDKILRRNNIATTGVRETLQEIEVSAT